MSFTPFSLSLGKSIGNTVFTSESHVVHAAATTVFLYEFCDCAVGKWLQEALIAGVAHFEESGGDFLIFHNLLFAAFEAENSFIIFTSLCQIGHLLIPMCSI